MLNKSLTTFLLEYITQKQDGWSILFDRFKKWQHNSSLLIGNRRYNVFMCSAINLF